ncbi:helix-turn-helix domain-containing protein [Candidatus Thiodubiliella endoseptemdiera]|uniref:Helix-turn-helix transcriptional regulator n=1 Tax=Candidatus Thiodubiliella endoseptemdiera TaxID=2738886 RepID=A0A853F5K7_9GAMM|nr:helix-turn-helix transcriptional regulator [Candidatus Thiodubiliella endoseptemdiera]
MTTKYTNQEAIDFFHDIFNPTGDALINTKAYDLMGQYLTQIEQALESQSMTQKELANKIGTSASYISQFFNLNKLINFKTLAKIELALGIDFELKQSITNSMKNKNNIAQARGKFSISNVNLSVSNAKSYANYVAA